jgi:hypothetical protein
MVDHAHPLRGTTIVLALFAALVSPVVLSLDEFAAYFLAGAFFGGAHSAILWGATRHEDPLTPAVLTRVAGAAAAGSVVGVTAACLVPAIGAGGTLLVLAAVVAAPYLLRRLDRKRPGRSRSVVAPATLDLLTPPLQVFSTAEISAAWATSQEALQRSTSPADRSAIAALRQAYLDELESRDASGLRRWLESGSALTSDPRPYLRASGQGDPEPDTH